MRTAPHQERWPLGAALAIFALAFAFLAWPWLSGAVTIPWDAKAQFYPQLTFLAQSLARGEAPFWTPFVFGGWPQIADPQSLIFSPAHLVLAFFNADPSFFAADAVTFALLFTGGVGVLLLFRERGWHPAGAIVAALAFSFGGSAASRIQHTGQIASLALLPVALWLLASAMRRRSGLRGAAAGLVIAAIALGRDQVALLSLYVLAGFVAAYWLDGPDRLARMRATLIPLAGAADRRSITFRQGAVRCIRRISSLCCSPISMAQPIPRSITGGRRASPGDQPIFFWRRTWDSSIWALSL